MSKVLDKNDNEVNTDVELTLREVIQEELAHREISVSEFCELLNVNELVFRCTINSNNITPCLALKIEKELDISAEFWLKIQHENQLYKLKQLRDEITK
jgi:plasmid maintenance system antidote protein VapI